MRKPPQMFIVLAVLVCALFVSVFAYERSKEDRSRDPAATTWLHCRVEAGSTMLCATSCDQIEACDRPSFQIRVYEADVTSKGRRVQPSQELELQ